MADPKKLPPHMLGDLREYLGVEREDPSKDDAIARMDEWDMLDAYLRYNGVINMTTQILTAVEGVKAAQFGAPAERRS